MRPLTLLFLLALGASAKPLTVTLDVKDAEARDVLKSMQKQCGVKNLVIDPDVPRTTASFYFRDVPCATAFKVVLRTYGLTTDDVQVLR